MRRAAAALALASVACAAPRAQQPAAGASPQPRAATAGGDSTARRPGGVGAGGVSAPNADPFLSTYRPFPSRSTVIRNVTIMTAAGPTIRNGAVLLRDG